jgi:hypothetical protein
VESEKIISKNEMSGLSFRFHARDLNLVMGSNGQAIPFQVLMDGQPPGKNHGVDTDEKGNGQIDSDRLYQLIRQTGDGLNSDHTFEIKFLSPGAEAYVFTFG